MISVISLYQDCVQDDINEAENGYEAAAQFNRALRRADTQLLGIITGSNVESPGTDFPLAYNKQKFTDYKKKFIVKKPYAGSSFTLPEDYYTYDNLYRIGSMKEADCTTGEILTNVKCDSPIEMVEGQEFKSRCNSKIKGLRPERSPIAKIVDNGMEVAPDGMSMVLEYVRYPKEAKLATTLDLNFNIPVPDVNASVDIEWDEWARESLVWFIVNKFITKTRERAAKENLIADKPKP